MDDLENFEFIDVFENFEFIDDTTSGRQERFITRIKLSFHRH